MTLDFWNERYAGDELAYGDEPNDFLRDIADRLPRAGRAVDLAAGQGRNAVFLASLGLDVLAVDQSEVGLRRSEELAAARGVALRTEVADLREFDVEPGSLDVVSSIFVHLPSSVRTSVHGRVSTWLRPGGLFVFEWYGPGQLGRGTGGPNDPDQVASLEVITSELDGFDIEHGAEVERDVLEGRYHTGASAVVQVLARKR